MASQHSAKDTELYRRVRWSKRFSTRKSTGISNALNLTNEIILFIYQQEVIGIESKTMHIASDLLQLGPIQQNHNFPILIIFIKWGTSVVTTSAV